MRKIIIVTIWLPWQPVFLLFYLFIHLFICFYNTIHDHCRLVWTINTRMHLMSYGCISFFLFFSFFFSVYSENIINSYITFICYFLQTVAKKLRTCGFTSIPYYKSIYMSDLKSWSIVNFFVSTLTWTRLKQIHATDMHVCVYKGIVRMFTCLFVNRIICKFAFNSKKYDRPTVCYTINLILINLFLQRSN